MRHQLAKPELRLTLPCSQFIINNLLKSVDKAALWVAIAMKPFRPQIEERVDFLSLQSCPLSESNNEATIIVFASLRRERV